MWRSTRSTGEWPGNLYNTSKLWILMAILIHIFSIINTDDILLILAPEMHEKARKQPDSRMEDWKGILCWIPKDDFAAWCCAKPANPAGLSRVLPKPQSKAGTDAVYTNFVTTSHVAVRWFSSPHGAPSGVCTGQRKPQDSGSSLRTVVVLILAKSAPLCTQRKWDR